MAGHAQAPRSRRALIARPLALFALISATVFVLAQLHLAKPGLPSAAAGTKVAVGDSYRGGVAFDQTCGGCHGAGGKGGGIGPRLIGDRITLAAVKQQIDAGGGAMPPALVKGAKERDILAFVATIIKQPAATG
jgi:mono/diheme cytochrome c family protein